MKTAPAAVSRLEDLSTRTGPITRDPERRAAFLAAWRADLAEATTYVRELGTDAPGPVSADHTPSQRRARRAHYVRYVYLTHLARFVRGEATELLAVTLGESARHPERKIAVTGETH